MKLDSSLSGLCVSKVSAKMKNDDFQIFGALTRDHTYEVRTHANAGRCINENKYANAYLYILRTYRSLPVASYSTYYSK